MCLKCLMVALAQAQFEQKLEGAVPVPEQDENLMGEAAEPTQAVDFEGTYNALELDRMRAETRSINADTILKLANAAHALYKANLDTSGVLRTLDQLYYPATPEVVNRREEGQTEAPAPEPAPETPAHDDVMDELPEQIRKEIAEMRAAGFKVEIVKLKL